MDEFQRNGIGRREGPDAFPVAEQDRRDHFFCDEAGGGANDADVLAFGENDPLGMAAELSEERMDDGITCGGFGGKVGHGKSGACSTRRL